MDEDKWICACCVSDDYLRTLIASGVENGEPCDYCSATGPTIDLADLVSRLDTVIENFYELSSETDAVVYFDREPEGEPVSDLLERFVTQKR